MRKILFLLLFLLIFVGSVVPQATLQAYTYQIQMQGQTAIGTTSGNVTNTGSTFHQLVWNVSGTVTTCSVTVDSSTDGITWTTGGIIAAQTCTSNGTFTSVSIVSNFVRINLSTLSGTGATFNTILKGYNQNPSGINNPSGFTSNSGVNAVRISGSNVTISSASQTVITGLSWTLPANTAANYGFDCYLNYQEATAVSAVTWSVNDVSLAPTAGNVSGTVETSPSAASFNGSFVWTTTGSKTIITATPSATVTTNSVELHGLLEQPSGVASVLQIEVSDVGANQLTIYRGSHCYLYTTAN